MVEKVTIWNYLEPFLTTRETLHLADISKQLKKPHPTARQHLNYLEKQGILIKTHKGRLTLYHLNKNHPLIIDYLVLAEKEKLIKSCNENLILNELVSFLHKTLDESGKALLFGSAAVNIKKANDIDLMLIGTESISEELKIFEKKFNIKIHAVNAKDLKSISESLKIEIQKKHLIIQGSEAIIKWLI